MADDNELSGKVGLDTSGFKAGVTDLNAQIRSIETGFRASAAVMGDWSSKSEGLKQRTDSLTDKLELQKKKLTLLNQEYQKTVAEQGANSKAAQSLANQMFSAEKAIQSTENDLKKFTEELKKVNDAEKKVDFSSLKDGLSKVGSGAVAGLKAAGAAIAGIGTLAVGAAAGLAAMVTKASENADELQKLSDTTGMSAEKLQELRYVGSAVGVDLDTMVGAQTKLIKSMSAAQSGTKAQVAAFQELGVSVTDSQGNLRDSNAVFQEAISKLGQMKNPTEQSALAMKIFGKSAMELNPLIRAGGDQIAALTAEAQKSGAIMSNETVSQLDSFGDSVDALKLSAQGMAGTLSAMALPALNSLTGLLGNMSVALNTALKTGDFSEFGQVLADGITNAVGQLSGMTGKLVPMVTQVLTSIINALVAAIPQILPALTNGIVQLIQAVVTILQTNGPMLISAGIQAVLTIIKGLVQALPDIINAALQMILSLADALTQQLPTLIPVAVDAIITIVNGLINNLPQLIRAAINIVIAIVQGIASAIPQLVQEIPKIIIAIIDALVSALPMIIEAAPQIIVSLVTGLIQAIPILLAAIPQIIKAIWDTISNVDWLTLGKNILQGIWNGISSLASWLWSQVTGLFTGIVDGVKSVLGIKSPSKVFSDIGMNLMLGLGNGIDHSKNKIYSQMKDVTDTIKNTAADMSGSLNINSTTEMNNTSLDTTNALISAINMAAMKISSAPGQSNQPVNYSFALDGINLGRGIFPYIISEAKRLGMIDSSGNLKVKAGAL